MNMVWLFEPFRHEFMQRALFGCALIGFTNGALSSFIVVRRLALMAEMGVGGDQGAERRRPVREALGRELQPRDRLAQAAIHYVGQADRVLLDDRAQQGTVIVGHCLLLQVGKDLTGV